jgi:hypothetical protein
MSGTGPFSGPPEANTVLSGGGSGGGAVVVGSGIGLGGMGSGVVGSGVAILKFR